MKTLTSNINVQVESRDKDQANNIGKKTNPKPSDELLDALKEGEDIIQEIKDGKRTGYNNVNEMLRAIIND